MTRECSGWWSREGPFQGGVYVLVSRKPHVLTWLTNLRLSSRAHAPKPNNVLPRSICFQSRGSWVRVPSPAPDTISKLTNRRLTFLFGSQMALPLHSASSVLPNLTLPRHEI